MLIPRKSIALVGENVLMYRINPTKDRIEMSKYGANLFRFFIKQD